MDSDSPVFVGVTIHADQGGEEDVYPGHPLLYVERYTIELLRMLGLEPYLIPVYKDCSLPPLKHLNGMVFTGGGYLNLTKNQSKLSNLGTTGMERYMVDKKLIEYGLENGLPMIGFCRGAQMINEVLGGTLINIPVNEYDHHQERSNIPGDQPVHSIRLKSESNLHSIMQVDTLDVNSFHRQSMATLGKGLISVAESEPDNIIEAFESISHPFLYGFQFHPEKLYSKQPIWNKFFEEFSTFVKSGPGVKSKFLGIT